MQNGWMPVAVMLAALFLGAFGAWAGEGYDRDGAAVQKMARIVLNMSHYPSETDKSALKAIAERATTSEHERAIATAIRRIEHTPTDADRQRLQAIAEDASAPGPVRDLARAVLGFEHQPTEEAQARLRAILDG